MANLLETFFDADDELAFLRFLARYRLEVYPMRVPPDWKPFIADENAHAKLPEESLYFAASEIAPVLVDKVKRGPDKGSWRVDEVRSPVIFFERSRLNDDCELLSGKLWAELEITAQTGRRDPAPDRFRRLYLEIEEWVKKTCRRGEPKGFWIGPRTARRAKEGLVLRNAEHRGGTVAVYK